MLNPEQIRREIALAGPNPGNVWFVSSTNGNNKLSGKTNQSAVATLQQAHTLASAGDTIYVLPGHVERISTATLSFLSKAGISVIGVGNGAMRPTFTFDTATTSTFNISGSSIMFMNCVFVANFAAIVAPFTLTTAVDFFLSNCEFRDTSAILNFVNVVVTSTTSNQADGLKLDGCKRIGLGATSATTIVKMLGTNDRITFTNNDFAHAAVTDAGLMPIATGKVVTNLICRRNSINLVGATGATTGILITTDGTTNSGLIDDNRVWSLDATSEILVTANAGFKFGVNYYSAVADKSGYIVPAQDA